MSRSVVFLGVPSTLSLRDGCSDGLTGSHAVRGRSRFQRVIERLRSVDREPRGHGAAVGQFNVFGRE